MWISWSGWSLIDGTLHEKFSWFRAFYLSFRKRFALTMNGRDGNQKYCAVEAIMNFTRKPVIDHGVIEALNPHIHREALSVEPENKLNSHFSFGI